MGYRFVRFLVRLILTLTAHIEVENIDLLPSSGAYIVVGNHIGRMDVVMVYSILNRPDIILIIAEKYRKHFYWRWLTRLVDGIWIDRFQADFSAMREVLRRLAKGWVLTIAPEGTRSPDGKLQAGREGASYLAAKSGVLVFPAGMTGCEDAVVKASLKRFKRVRIHLRVGEPFILPPLKRGDRQAQLEEYTEEIMCRIAALLPEDRRGVYADHPRLKELLIEENK